MNSSASTSALPLAGMRVLVTRPRDQSEALAGLLRRAGAIPVELPVIEIVPAFSAELDAALDDAGRYDWLVFTSVNTVRIVTDRLQSVGDVKIAAIGDATAAALRERGITVDLVPEQFVAESLLDALIDGGVIGRRILLPSADIARSTLPDGLRSVGATVDVVVAYSARLPVDVDQEIIESIHAGEIDVVTLTSPSAVHNLLALTDGSLPEGTRIACIGEITAQSVRDVGLKVDVVAGVHTIPGLVQALLEMGESDEPV